jgi:hypothetical protein
VRCEPACLFRLDTDPSEHDDRALAEPALLQHMLGQLRAVNGSTLSPDRGKPDLACACQAAMGHWGGFWGWGPWVL